MVEAALSAGVNFFVVMRRVVAVWPACGAVEVAASATCLGVVIWPSVSVEALWDGVFRSAESRSRVVAGLGLGWTTVCLLFNVVVASLRPACFAAGLVLPPIACDSRACL